MAQETGKKGWLGIGLTVGVLGILAVVAIWLSLEQSTNPDYQIRTQRTGVGEYFVNLWTDPNPVTTGEVEFSSQLTTIIGSPIELTLLEFDVIPPDDGEQITLDTEHTFDGPNDGDLYVATAQIDRPGTWQVIVRYRFGAGADVVDEFAIEVAE